MDAQTSHVCPLCRVPFCHFPVVCAPLHAYLAATFMDEMGKRNKETKQMEADEFGADSPAVAAQSSGDSGFDVRASFKCVNFGMLAVPLTVLTCVHVACFRHPRAILLPRTRRCLYVGGGCALSTDALAG